MSGMGRGLALAVEQATAALKEAEGIAKLCNAAIHAHDENATALTEARKVLRMILDNDRKPMVNSSDLAPGDRARLSTVIDMLNTRIIESRKLVKGELP